MPPLRFHKTPFAPHLRTLGWFLFVYVARFLGIVRVVTSMAMCGGLPVLR